MGYERYPRGTMPQGDDEARGDYGSGRDDGYSSARDYAAAGETGDSRRGYGGRDYGNQRYAQRDARYGSQQGGRGYGADDDHGRSFGRGHDAGERGRYGQSAPYHGSYASDGRRFEDVGRYRDADDDYRSDRGRFPGAPQGRDEQDRGFFQRAGDEVRSWFGDDDAERRREEDSRRDERDYGRDAHGADRHRDSDYHSWRSGQIAALDRDYDEYRQENRARFNSEFSTWRTGRQGQRDLLTKVGEHMEVAGSDGEHVGTVDKVRGDRILLTKTDADAGGRHHSIPSRWIQSVDTKVTLAKTAAEAKQQWQDEERNQAMFQYGDNAGEQAGAASSQASSRSASTAKTY